MKNNQVSDSKTNQASDTKSQQKPKESNSKQKKFCRYCKKTNHIIDDCFKLKNKTSQSKQVNKVEDNHSIVDSKDHSDFGAFNALCAVDILAPGIQTFDAKMATHPLATDELLMTKINV